MNILTGINKVTRWIILAVIVLIAVFLVYKACERPTNDVVEDIRNPPKVEYIRINDSLAYMKQEILLVQSRKTIAFLQDSLQRVVNKHAKVKPVTIINYKESVTLKNLVTALEGSLWAMTDSLEDRDERLRVYDSLSSRLLLTPSKFSIKNNKWFSVVGRVPNPREIALDSINFFTEPFITIGEKGRWYQRKTVTVTVGNHNPYVVNSGLTSYQLKPKRQKFAIVVGPSVTTNIKHTTVGLGATFGYVIK